MAIVNGRVDDGVAIHSRIDDGAAIHTSRIDDGAASDADVTLRAVPVGVEPVILEARTPVHLEMRHGFVFFPLAELGLFIL